MTGYNNLALMLDEVLQQLQQQMAQSMPKLTGDARNQAGHQSFPV